MSKIVFDKILGKLKEDPEGSGASWGSITGTLANQTDLNDELNGKMERVECTYAVDSDPSVLTPSSGDTCLVKTTGKIHTYDGTAWDAGTLGATGAIYIAEGESYIYDTNKFVLLSTENAMTLNGKQDTYFAAATDLSAHIANTTPHVTTADKNRWNQRQISMDFGSYEDTISVVNAFGAININRVVADNAATIKLSHGSTIQQSVTAGVANINIADGETMIWEITRTAANANAALAIRFTIN